MYKGVPIRLEVGPKDLAKNEVRSVRRDNGDKAQLSISGLAGTIQSLLSTIQQDMFNRATETRNRQLKYVTEWKDFVPALDSKSLVMIPWCEQVKCEEAIKENSAKV